QANAPAANGWPPASTPRHGCPPSASRLNPSSFAHPNPSISRHGALPRAVPDWSRSRGRGTSST
ncbi:MAG: hypothetical protein PVG14_14345, partial [Anaerolineales bacterium]